MGIKIDYIKLENLVSIHAGLGKNKLEIDFTKGKNDKIMFIGNNGCGKTAILSNLHPYRNTNDDREMSILDGSPKAYKEIHFNKNGVKYIIQHHYGKNSTQNKSFISKDSFSVSIFSVIYLLK